MLINSRFKIDSLRNEVLDNRTGKIVRLEARLMKLLSLLIENRGQIVTRDVIINKIWDDYPGAGEGLNQAISALRKLLEDDQKEIIETLPKTGYCFQGTIGKSIKKTKPVIALRLTYVFAGILILLGVLFLARYYQLTEASIANQSSQKEARDISKIDSAHQAKRLKTIKGN